MGACFNKDDCDGQQKKSALGNISTAMSTIYANPPASGIAFVHDTLASAGFAKPAYAQGIGFSALSTFLPFWKVTRNIAYTVIIIVMVAIGFMIIFRMKIDPKTVITIQAALPKIVVSLILITFSYPIVGFLVDIMYLSMAILIQVIVQGAGGQIINTNATSLQSTYLNGNIFDLFGAVIWAGLSPGLIPNVIAGGSTFTIGTLVTTIAMPGGIPAASGLVAIGAIVLLVLNGGLLFSFFRLLFLLINSYIQIIISVILAPLLLLSEAIPGRSAFGGWIQNILANLVVFPATAGLLLFAAWIGSTQEGGNAWAPPFISFGGQGLPILHMLLAIGIVFLAPSLVAAAKKAFNPQPALPFSAGTIFAPFTGTVNTAMSGMQTQYYFQQASHGPFGAFMGKVFGKGGGGGEHH
jgi:hypothetical protein